MKVTQEPMKYAETDTGYCRVYYKQERRLYCLQEEAQDIYEFYRCTDDGEPCVPVPLNGRLLEAIRTPSRYEQGFMDFPEAKGVLQIPANYRRADTPLDPQDIADRAAQLRNELIITDHRNHAIPLLNMIENRADQDEAYAAKWEKWLAEGDTILLRDEICDPFRHEFSFTQERPYPWNDAWMTLDSVGALARFCPYTVMDGVINEGRTFDDVLVFTTVDDANAYMERNENFGLLRADDEAKQYYLAALDNTGVPTAKPQSSAPGF